MTTGEGRGGRNPTRDWSELPSELLDLVYRGCCSSTYDRIRFAAVCSSWRAVASSSPYPKMPALPLLLPSTGYVKHDRRARAYILEETRAVRRPLRGFPWGKRIVGSHDGGWVAAVTADHRLFIMNVFSGTHVALSHKQSIIPSTGDAINLNLPEGETPSVTKIVFSEDPCSSSCILAAITTGCKVGVCRIGDSTGWTTPESTDDIYHELTDIAFCNGSLHGLSDGELYRFVIGVNGKGGAPVVTKCVPIISSDTRWDTSYDKYIFELGGKLAIGVNFSPTEFSHKKLSWMISFCNDHYFRVFVFEHSKYKWLEVKSLGDHALFLRPACSKAVHMPVTGRRGRVERNHIYYYEHQLCPYHETKCLERLDLGSYTVYYGENKGVNHSRTIRSSGYHYSQRDVTNSCIWLLPPDL